ncbi:MAG: PD-(D/E)XK motif protein, partial [Proteobacteria bacterium]
MRKIDKIWASLEEDNVYSDGILIRRYSNEVQPDIFVAIQEVGKIRSIGISVEGIVSAKFNEISELEDIAIEITADPLSRNKRLILIKLVNKVHQDIFSVLCEDLIHSVWKLSDENLVVSAIVNRLSKWKSLFENAYKEGLTPEAQRGLFGELYLLSNLIQNDEHILE